MKRIVPLLLLLASTAYGAPKGKNLTDAKYWLEAEQGVKKKGTVIAEKCDAKVTVGFDDASYRDVAYDDARAAAACQHALDAIATICTHELGATAVREKLKNVACRYSTTGTKVTLTAGNLVVHLDPKNTWIQGDKPGGYSWKSAIEERL